MISNLNQTIALYTFYMVCMSFSNWRLSLLFPPHLNLVEFLFEVPVTPEEWLFRFLFHYEDFWWLLRLASVSPAGPDLWTLLIWLAFASMLPGMLSVWALSLPAVWQLTTPSVFYWLTITAHLQIIPKACETCDTCSLMLPVEGDVTSKFFWKQLLSQKYMADNSSRAQSKDVHCFIRCKTHGMLATNAWLGLEDFSEWFGFF